MHAGMYSWDHASEMRFVDAADVKPRACTAGLEPKEAAAQRIEMHLSLRHYRHGIPQGLALSPATMVGQPSAASAETFNSVRARCSLFDPVWDPVDVEMRLCSVRSHILNKDQGDEPRENELHH